LGVKDYSLHVPNELWDRCTIDRFASNYNNPHERFNSKVWTPGTEKIDAFSQF
jgi:hypothetical protein